MKSATEISNVALQDHDAMALKALNLFVGWRGSMAGDLALPVGAHIEAVWHPGKLAVPIVLRP
jgi:glucokinase